MGSAAVIPDNLWRNSSVEESYVGKEVTGGRNSGTPVPSGQYSENDIFISVYLSWTSLITVYFEN
jgi:hypothetical protein